MPYTRIRKCDACSREETVRKDNASTTCVRCNASRNGLKTAAKRKAVAIRRDCKQCGSKCKSAKAQYCSPECYSAHHRILRTCKCCGDQFTIIQSSLKGNASGNFCSRPCYERWLCRTDRTTGRGSQWAKARKKALASFPFCAVCGTPHNLQIHHIIPYRLTHDNSHDNLIPLCVKHHKWVEIMFVETEAHGIDAATSFMWKNILRSKQQVTAILIKEALNAHL